MSRLFSVVQFKSLGSPNGRSTSKVMLFKNKVLMGSSPGSAARKAITFICRRTAEKKGCSSMIVQLKEVKLSMKNGKKTLVSVGATPKLYNYTGKWDPKKRSIAFKNRTIEFKGTPVVKSCSSTAGKARSPLCKLFGKRTGLK